MTTGEDIAARFETVNGEAVDVITGPARDHWHTLTTTEGWPVGVTARHIALGHELMAQWADALARREPLVPPDDIHHANAEQAAHGVVADPDEVAALLHANGSRVSAALRRLTAEDLVGEVDFGGRTMPSLALAEAAIRHVTGHIESIRAVIEA